jgi:cytochrome c oxidase accessory protein FixG
MDGDASQHDALASHGVERIAVDAVHAPGRGAFFQAREKIFPQRVHGLFRRLKWLAMAVTLTIYYVTPWLRWDRGPGAPSQAVLVDLPGRRFYFLFIELWPQEVYYFTGLLILAAVALFLVTALAGRVWCGYTCPQTIWTDLFLAVERAIEGDRNARIRLDRAPWNASKLAKRLAKHAAFLLIAVATGGAWVFYFADAPTLAQQLVTGAAPVPAYVFVGIFAVTTYLLGGIAREQVCIYMCPWPRIQSAMIDDDTLAVTYRHDRGEPRGPHKKGESWTGRGDCVDCRQCVAACPMGVDIRQGLQLPCIQCALCIDACDAVMAKVGRPAGLIGYDTDLNIARRQRGEAPSFKPVRVRTVAYAAILVAVGSVMLWSMLTRHTLDLAVLPDRNPPFVRLSSGDIRNAFTVKLSNKSREPLAVAVFLDGPPGATLSAINLPEVDGRVHVTIDPDSLHAVRMFVTVPQSAFHGEVLSLRFLAADRAGGPTLAVPASMLGPGKE